MRILSLGISHHTAAVEVREKLALAGDQLEHFTAVFRSTYPQAELVALSTCNRTELYIARPTHESPSIEQLRQMLGSCCQVSEADLLAVSVHRENDQAVTHLFRVACGLESMVLGEPQILGQVRRAYELACSQRSIGMVLHRVFQRALAVGKQVRTQTAIDSGRTSIGSVAVDFARQIFERFDDKVIVGIGAGEMAKLTLTHLRQLAPAKLWIANRSLPRAQALAEQLDLRAPQAGVRPLQDLDHLLVEADIVLTSTGATEPIITAARMQPLLRKRRLRPLCIIDIAVPRDVEAAVGSLRNVFLYNIDHLQQVVAQTHQGRTAELEACEHLAGEAARECLAQIQHNDIGQLIRKLRQRLTSLGEAEQARTLRRLQARGEDVEALLQEHTHRLINKILHLPLSQLDHRQTDAPLGFYAAALRKLFDLDTVELPSGPPPQQDAAPGIASQGLEDAEPVEDRGIAGPLQGPGASDSH